MERLGLLLVLLALLVLLVLLVLLALQLGLLLVEQVSLEAR
jgi:hypothetical protein